jgi:hypothetical protein
LGTAPESADTYGQTCHSPTLALLAAARDGRTVASSRRNQDRFDG